MKTTRDQSCDNACGEKPNDGMSRRDAIRSIGGAAIGAALVGSLTQQADAQTITQAARGTPPFQGIRIIEQSQTLAGRLAGQLFADQGAEVFVERVTEPSPGGL